MKRKLAHTVFISLLILISSSNIASANDKSETEKTHPAQSFLPQSCYHSGNYRQSRHIEGLEKPIESKGRFIFSCKNGLIWHTQSPITETVLYPLKGKSSKIQAGHAEELDGRLHKHLGKLLNAIIGAEYTYLDKHFELSANDTRLTLQPTRRRMKKFISSVNIEQQAEATKISLLGKSEFNTEIEISGTREYSQLDTNSCQEHFTESILACQLMFK